MILTKSNLLLIGGSGRNVGKSTLANYIIKNISHKHNVIGLKVSTLRIGEEQFHGDEHIISENGYKITQEDSKIPHKDTAQMIACGARKAYYLQTKEDFVLEAYTEFEKKYNPDHLPVICESRALRKYIKPGLFLIIVDPANRKNDSMQFENLADQILYYRHNDLTEISQFAESIEYDEFNWKINKK